MTFVEIEELIRRFLSTGITAVVIIVGPAAGGELAQTGGPDVVVVEPGVATSGPGSGGTGGTVATTGSGGSADPGAGAGSTGSDGTDADGAGVSGTDGDGSGAGRTRSGGTSSNGTPSEGAPSGGSPSGSRADPGRAPADVGTGRTGTGTTGATPAGDGVTAADTHGWGRPDREDDFSGTLAGWDVYEGPGHAGEGMRSASAISVEDGVLTITGGPTGTTGGMAWNPGQKYGRWEGRVKAPAGDGSYDALLLLWPDAEDFPVGGEIDFMEMQDPTRRTTDLFVHHGADNSQVNGQVEIDGTAWHNWAVEWTPEAITAYVDGEEWFRTTDTSIFPPGPMHLSIQLDWFPQGATATGTTMMVDWVRQYSLDGEGGSPGSTAPGNGPTSGGSTASGSTGGPSTGPESSGADGSPGSDPTGGTGESGSGTGGDDDVTPIVDVPKARFWR